MGLKTFYFLCDRLGMDENNVEVAKVQFHSLLMALDTKISASSNDFSVANRRR